MIEQIDSLPEKAKENITREKQPDWMDPMLATLSHEYFSDEEWIFERKFDGVRCLVFRSGEDLRLMSRNRKIINGTYPE